MSLSTIKRSALVLEQEIQNSIMQFNKATSDFTVAIKSALNHRIASNNAEADFYKLRLIGADEVFEPVPEEECIKLLTGFGDARRVLRQKVTNAQNTFLKYRNLVHSTQEEFGMEGIEIEVRENLDLVALGAELDQKVKGLWKQCDLCNHVLDTIEKVKDIKYRDAQVLISIWVQ